MSLVDPGLLKILCCPETRQSVREADAALIAGVNTRIASGSVTNRGGKPVADKIEGGLLRQDGQVLYPIRKRIPILVVEEGIPMTVASP